MPEQPTAVRWPRSRDQPGIHSFYPLTETYFEALPRRAAGLTLGKMLALAALPSLLHFQEEAASWLGRFARTGKRQSFPMDEILIGLFYSPHAGTGGARGSLVQGLIEHFAAQAPRDNNTSPNLAHTEMLRPGDGPCSSRRPRSSPPNSLDFGAQPLRRAAWAGR